MYKLFPFALVIKFVAEAGQFNHIKVALLHFGRHFVLDESECSGSLPLHCKSAG